jgi:two-component system OmpR family response regulator
MSNPVRPNHSKETSSNPPSKGLVLVVEDDEDNREVLCMILNSLGYDHIAFPTGEGVLEGITGKKIVLAMLDIMMPRVDGYEVLNQLRTSDEFSSIPVFMVTAKGEDEEILAGYNFGADYYIMKPFSSRQIEFGIKLFLEKPDESPKALSIPSSAKEEPTGD